MKFEKFVGSNRMFLNAPKTTRNNVQKPGSLKTVFEKQNAKEENRTSQYVSNAIRMHPVRSQQRDVLYLK